MTKVREKLEAIRLRKEGFSYTEILRKVPVRKSTLSVWLRDIGLAKRHIQRFTEKRRLAQMKARESWRRYRINKQERIIKEAKGEIKNLTNKDLWLAGVLLYWAEGTKQKATHVSQRVSFGNSDPNMVILFSKWLKRFCDIESERIIYSIYIHRTGNVEKAKKFWNSILNTSIENVYFKKHNPKTNRKNINENYNGLLRIDVRKSTDLNRKIQGWTLGVIENLKHHCPIAKR